MVTELIDCFLLWVWDWWVKLSEDTEEKGRGPP